MVCLRMVSRRGFRSTWSNMLKHPFVVAFWLILVGGLTLSFGLWYLGIVVPKHYWNGKGIVDTPLGAPDGVYEVLPIGFGSGLVQFPICSHSYGFLHGIWQYDNCSGLVHFVAFESCFVLLRDNVIVRTGSTYAELRR